LTRYTGEVKVLGRLGD